MARRANGDGTVYKKANGRWGAQIQVTLKSGESKRVTVSGKTRNEALKKLRVLSDQENRRIAYIEKEWTVAEYLDYWVKMKMRAKRVRETTLSTYQSMIKTHIKPIIGWRKLRDLSIDDIGDLMEILEKKGCSVAVIDKCLRILSACLNYAMKEEVIFRNVVQLAEKPEYTPMDTLIWTVEQAALFLQSIKEYPQYIAFLLLFIYGMRRGEVLGLRWCDIDFENGWIHIRQQIGRVNGELKVWELKTKSSRRALPMMSFIRQALLDHAKRLGITPPPFNPYFELSMQGTVVVSEVGTPLEPRNLARCFHGLTKRVGLPRIKLHAIRHTTATILKDLKAPIRDVQYILGHAKADITLSVYQHSTPETQRTVMSSAEDRLFWEFGRLTEPENMQ